MTKMENPNAISDMWAELQASNSLPKTLLLGGCATELRELMHQIDVMIAQKRITWEREKESLQTKNDTKKQELAAVKAALQLKQQEVKSLQQRLDGLPGDTQQDLNLEYERQLQHLRQEVAQIKEDYDRHHRKCTRQVKEVQREKTRALTEVKTLSEQLSRLSEKLEDYRHNFHEARDLNLTYQKEIEALHSQMKTSSEKYDLSQQQLGSFQTQVDKRRDLLEMTETNLKSKITHLESQLSRSRDTVNSQDSQIARLKASLDSALSSHKRALAEKEAVEREMLKSQRTVRRLENEKGEVSTAAAIKDEHLHAWKAEQERLVGQISELQHTLEEKDRLIQSLEQSTKLESSDVTHQVKEAVHQLKADLKKAHKNEQRLQDEKRRLEAELGTARQDCVTLNEELTARVDEVRRLEGTGLKKFKLEVAKLQECLAVSEQRRTSEVCALRAEVSRALTDLHDRDLTLASLSQRSSASEHQLREQFEQLENSATELHIASTELEDLRAENRSLRLMTLGGVGSPSDGSNSVDTDASFAQQQISELRDSYSVSVKSLEKQNHQLVSEVGCLKERLRAAEEDTRQRLEELQLHEEKAVDRVKDEEAKRIQEVRKSCDQQTDTMRSKLRSTVSVYEAQIDRLRHQVEDFRTEAEAQSKTAERLGLENEVMTHFVIGVDEIVQCPPHREDVERHLVEGDYASGDASRLTAVLPSSNHDDTNPDLGMDDTYDCADSVIKHFLDEQKQWTEVLEQQLDSHIHAMKASSETILQKYVTK